MIPADVRRRARGTSTGERGAVTFVVALSLVAILLLAAVVIDLGYTRSGAMIDQSKADLAALAGGDALLARDYPRACRDILDNLRANTPDLPAIDVASFCAPFATTVCSGGTLAQATPTITAGRYTIALRFPVSDAEIADPTFGKGNLDGFPCERIRVTVSSQEPSFFGGVGGRSSYAATRSATVRGGASQTRLVPALWLLDPVGCGVLNVQGGSKVVAGDVSDPTNVNPGVINLDSTGEANCGPNSPTLVTGGNGTEVRAVPLTGDERGEISLRALPFGATSCAGTVACDQSAVGSQILPQPTPVDERATRAPVDWAWNCKASYPNYLGVPIAPCPDAAERGPFVDRLVAALGSSGAPSGFQRWTSAHSCSPSGAISVTGNWWVDCRTPNGLSISNGTTVTFRDGNVVFDGGIKLNSGGVLNLNTNNASTTLPLSCSLPGPALPCTTAASSRAAFAYVRRGDWNLGGGTLNGSNVAIVLAPTSFLRGSGGSPPNWTAPSEGPFGGLALWAEASGAFTLSGGAGVTLRGTFFTPFADELTLTGGGNWGQQNAQFISYRLKVAGGSLLTMAPDPTSAVILPPSAASLIR